MRSSLTRSLIIVAVFSLLSFLLGFVKFGGASSIALDAFPSYFVAGFYGPLLGAPVAAVAHLLSAVSGGFPFSVPVHLFIAVEQALWAYLFGAILRYSNDVWFLVVAVPAGIVCNGYLGPKLIGWVFPALEAPVSGLIPVLLVASAVNVALAAAAILALRKTPLGHT
ncbi:ECF transporter S component [Afifella sp. YEN Y35]|uniref:ECF transporter S component n=1 Tax=Afifella sp. YEN Y35 TaxID=3388337 RepID=UPI0039E03B7E